MWTLEAQKHGGQITSILMKKRAEEKYAKNPIKCLNCSKIIPLNGRRPSQVKKNKFCSSHCAAVFNNKKFPKRKPSKHSNPTSFCKFCGDIIYLKKSSENSYYNRTKCDKCLQLRAIMFNGCYLPKIENKTKKELFLSTKNYQSARSQILKHAFIKYNLSDRPKQCLICNYKKHFQVCHKKAVSNFSADTLIKEINDLNNLLPLCPTHHWEFDHGCLENPELIDRFISKYLVS